jgi:hypothetical protein
MRGGLFVAVVVTLCAACGTSGPPPLDPVRTAAIEGSIRAMTTAIAADLAREGPDGWLPHFSNAGNFFMVSDGVLVIPDLDAATAHVHQLDAATARVELVWDDLRVTPLSPTSAVAAASYHELIVGTNGAENRFKGLVTMLAVETPTGWRLQHLHWSTPLPPARP